jgi:dipeptidyl aminopeptidase/acylaminoacyl peptidase
MIIALALAATLANGPLTPEDYATMPSVSSPKLSPDGKRVAYVVTRADLEKSNYDADIYLVDADGRNPRRLTSSAQNDNRPRWSPDGKTLAFLSERDGGRSQIWSIDPAGGEAVRLTNEPTPVREFEWSPAGKAIAFTRIDAPSAEDEKRTRERDDARVIGANTRHSHLYLFENGKSRRLTSGSFSVMSAFSWSPDGKLIAFERASGLGLDDGYHADLYLTTTGEKPEMTPLVVQPGLDRGPRFSPDGKTVAFGSGGGVHDWLGEADLYTVPVSGGTPRLISRDYDRTFDSVEWSADGKSIWASGPWNATSQIYRLGADGSGFTNVSQFEGLVTDFDIAAGKGVFVKQSLTEAPEIFVTELAKYAPRQLTNETEPLFGPRKFAETRVIKWKHPQDGLEIEGFLTLPLDYKPGTKVPLITYVHGGPASRFDHGFLGYLGYLYAPQSLAASGFAIFRPNPRGTGGYGEAFRKANRNDWGGKDWEDINAGIDKLIADGIADPDRLGLMGWSYGGFMASWAIGNGNRFKAISIGAPVVDLPSMHGTSDIRDFLPHYFSEGRTPLERRVSLELLRSRSPLWNLKPTKIPILILHGESDDRVPLSQGTMLYRYLQELGADVTMVVYPRTPHVPREPKLRIDVARRNLDFFTRYIMVH